MNKELNNNDYIGDGLYVGDDGYHLWLYTHNGIIERLEKL